MGASQKLRTANIPNPLFNYCIKNPPFRIAAEVKVTLPNCFNAVPLTLWVPTQNKPTNPNLHKGVSGFFSLQSWGSQTSNFLFLALSGLKRSWPNAPSQRCCSTSQVFKLEFQRTSFSFVKWWEFPCPFSGVHLVCWIRWFANPPPVCGWKVMISIGPNQ